MTSSVDTVDDTEHTPDAVEAPDAISAGPAADDPVTTRTRKRRLRVVAAGLVAAAVVTGGVFGYLKYRGTADELARMHRAEADSNTAAQLAKDYALKSLTYSFEDPDAFFRSVEQGVSSTLKDKFVNATGFLKSLMLQAQVSSTGEVVATDPIAQPGDVYEVVVSAYQTTRNLQNPEPRVSVMLLQVTVNKVGDTWQVSDIGPKPGSHTPAEGQGVLPELSPAPAPATPGR
ncbi:hypothetical protein [Mycobacterium talmoniae]|uniref:Mce-associated membrane protein n=1 Tax=Mycobacterium talmoniae TaxID=1858794 RepID=A0A1S1NF92_9MYCO|nr:hypothetical protein [Mycobacterium talmoniae]OHV01576.1 hypothetical protein BKN37_16835 [Mycobacterium talmoniae]PQM49197.1 hypothetical protein C1Y40_00588 [Mycobacterium talmoniae]